eukprot:12393091-Alexandrium_andersonii.AAC.1
MPGEWKPSWQSWGGQRRADWPAPAKYWGSGRKKRPMRSGQRGRKALREEAERENASAVLGMGLEAGGAGALLALCGLRVVV